MVNPKLHPTRKSCTRSLRVRPGGTSGSGTFSDQWTLATDNVSPVGCGFTVNYDHWQMCFNDNPITFGTLNGYVHSNSINIEGSIMPPQSNQMQT
jgi:hypothetical protein